jgi:Tol biopolymer transport system component/C-terminal processing protease CtpA/Prc
MRARALTLCSLALCAVLGAPARGEDGEGPGEAVRFPRSMHLTPDGETVVLAWRGEIWRAPASGGRLTRLTSHPADDEQPRVSPDGRELAFVSDRTGSPQVWVMPLTGGAPRQVTRHSEGCRLYDWFPDGKGLLIRRRLDHRWHEADRFLRQPLEGGDASRALFDAPGGSAQVAPDGRRIAFTREGVEWWRKGYRGSAASQVWICDLETGAFTRVTQGDHGERWPLWSGDGSALLVTSQEDGAFNLWRHDLGTGSRVQLTRFEGDGVQFPAIAAGGRRVVFRRGLETKVLDLPARERPRDLALHHAGDATVEATRALTLTRADEAAFTDDAREIAFCAGGDLWVMDTELREPVCVTQTPGDERCPVFSQDHESLYFVGAEGGRSDLWRARRADATRWWWQQERFLLERLTDDEAVEADLRLTPDGERLSFVRGRGDLVTIPRDGGEPLVVVTGFAAPDYSFSPDGRWVAYSHPDDDFNHDVWIRATDGSGEPYNVSRHPDNDYEPAWSPDGKVLAFVGRRWGQETDVCFARLRKADDEVGKRDRALEKALEKMKGRKKDAPARPATEPGAAPTPAAPAAPEPPDPLAGSWRGSLKGGPPVPPDGFDLLLTVSRAEGGGYAGSVEVPGQFSGSLERLELADGTLRFALTTPLGPLAGTGTLSGERIEGTWSIEGALEGTFDLARQSSAQPTPPAPPAEPDPAGKAKPEAKKEDGRPEPVVVDFEGLCDRVQRIAIEHSEESRPFWSHDSKRLAFEATVAGQRGLHTVAFPDELEPKRLTTLTGRNARWLKEGDQIAWLQGGLPATLTGAGKATSFAFSARATVDLGARHRAAFDEAWRIARDRFYDARLGNRDWDAVRERYGEPAARCLDPEELEVVVNLMLGELNASHLGFRAKRSPWKPDGWQPVTGHLGCRFDEAHEGPGLRVRDVIEGTPAHAERSRLRAGEIVTRVDGVPVGPETDLVALLTGDPDREVVLAVRGAEEGSEEREVRLRPTTYDFVRRRLYDHEVRQRRARVEELSDGALGYLHVRGMDWSSFERFEEEIYAAGQGKRGLIVDVRDNGGGFTADHLLTCLTQPRHAVTVPRGGGPGYPQDRMVYARWDKPVCVLCNQNSFSNAEIFAHAIRTLRRGPIVGVPTAGGVISTGAASVLDVGTMRVPFRGWFVLGTGADMERNGCVPDHLVEALPGELPRGVDRQLEKAVEVLAAEVEAAAARPSPPLVPASAR